jgi:SAM-dependent methyltransferase
VLAVIGEHHNDDYRHVVESVYQDDPLLWEKVMGEQIWFQGGIYEHSPDRPTSLQESGERHFDVQMELAQAGSQKLRTPSRILDVGCGWGAELQRLAAIFPRCERIDGINVSRKQLDYCRDRISQANLTSRVNLYLCNAQDLAHLPDPEQLYDLTLMRGSSTHFPPDVLERTMAAMRVRMTPSATLVVAENLYRRDYKSAISDDSDRLACRHRKTMAYFVDVLERHGFTVQDMRKLPSNTEMIRWWHNIRISIENNLPGATPAVFSDLHKAAANMEAVLAQDTISAYSIIARRY